MARSFNGISDQIDAGSGVSATENITVSAWFMLNGTGSYLTIYSKEEFATLSTHLLAINGTHAAYYVKYSNTNAAVDPGSATLSTGVWYHITH